MEPASLEEEVRSHVEAWARAWSEQRVDDYIACYADDYAPAGMSHEAWIQQRRQRLLAPARISVRLADVEVTVIDAGRARVRFRQFYETESMNRRTTKIQELVRQPGGWKIVSERRAN